MTKQTTWILAAALVIGAAGSAHAGATAPALTATDNTRAGPGAISIPVGGTERIFFHSGGTTDLCVTVTNTGRAPIGINVTGATSPTGEAPVGGSEAVCAEDVTQIDLFCMAQTNCTAQWRVDSN